MSAPARALVAGGSLAGLMAALSLARVGHPVTVLEQAPRERPSGAALAVDEVALRRALGPERAATATRALGAHPGEPSRFLPATWRAVHDGLHAAADADPLITVEHGVSIVGAGADDRIAWLDTDGGHRVVADLLVGADGHRSIVRRQVAPERPDAAFAGYTLWLGVAEESELALGRRWPEGLDILSAGPHSLLGYPLPAEDGGSAPGTRRLGWAWFDATRNPLLRRLGSVVGDVAGPSLDGAGLDVEVVDDLLADASRTVPSPWREAIVAAVTRRAFVGTPIKEYLPVRLGAGRVVLVGDAAHVPTPMTGSGFAESIEDAAALGQELGGGPAASVAAAVERFGARRLGPARDLVESGQGFSRSFGRP